MNIDTQTSGQPLAIHAASVRLPQFAPNETLTWFRRAETQFRLKHISVSATKADYVLESLPESVFRRISSWLDEQPDIVPYESLKIHLLEIYSLSPSERALRIFAMPGQPLGDRTATQVWEEITSLCRIPKLTSDGTTHDQLDLKKEIWLQCLPDYVRSLMHDAHTSTVDVLTKKADALLAARRVSHTFPAATHASSVEDHRLHSVATPTMAPASPVQQPAWTSELCHPPDVSVVRPRPAQINKRLPTTGKLSASGICTFHLRFGERARNCVPGCTWSKNAVSGRAQ